MQDSTRNNIALKFWSAVLAAAVLSPLTTQAATFEKDLGYVEFFLRSINKDPAVLQSMRLLSSGSVSYSFNKDEAPWAGNYFPMVRGGMANRWRGTNDPAWKILTEEQARRLKNGDISKLSPTEKMDLYRDDYTFSITRTELQHRGPLRTTPPVQGWEGFCNGMRAAGIMTHEPLKSVEVRNQAGQKIKFEPADLKALAGLSYFFVEKFAMIGVNSVKASATNTNATTDQSFRPNAGVFDIVLRTMIGHLKMGFVIDKHVEDQIWNEAVLGYKRTLGQERAATATEAEAGAAKVLPVSLELPVLGEISIDDSNKETQKYVSDGSYAMNLSYKYVLYLNAEKQIVGGRWEGDAPDFAWFVGGKGTVDSTTNGNPSPNKDLHFDDLARLLAMSTKNGKANRQFSGVSELPPAPAPVEPAATPATDAPVAAQPEVAANTGSRAVRIEVHSSGRWSRFAGFFGLGEEDFVGDLHQTFEEVGVQIEFRDTDLQRLANDRFAITVIVDSAYSNAFIKETLKNDGWRDVSVTQR